MKFTLLFLLLLNFNLFATQQDFDKLRKIFSSECRLAGLTPNKSRAFNYSEKFTLLQNMDKFAEGILQHKLKNSEITWLKMGLLYNTYSRWPDSGFWMSMGYGYQAIKINSLQGHTPRVGKLLTLKVSAKYPEMYFLHGQYCSMLIKLVRALPNSSLENCNQLITDDFAEDWHNAIALNCPLDLVGYDSLEAWFQQESLINAQSVMAPMPINYVATEFDSLFRIQWTKITEEGKESLNISLKDAVTKVFNAEVCKAIGAAYYKKAFNLWIESPVVIRPRIKMAIKGFEELKKGKTVKALLLLQKSRAHFSTTTKRATAISQWLDEAETATVSAADRFKVYQKVFNTTAKSKYSRLLDSVERKLEQFKQ